MNDTLVTVLNTLTAQSFVLLILALFLSASALHPAAVTAILAIGFGQLVVCGLTALGGWLGSR